MLNLAIEREKEMTTQTKPGRLTDSKWWFCEIGQHGKCAIEVELTSCFEACPCECHQKLGAPQSAPDADTLRHLPLLIEAAKGIVNVYTWRRSKGYTRALKEGVMELETALKPFLVDGPQTTEESK